MPGQQQREIFERYQRGDETLEDIAVDTKMTVDQVRQVILKMYRNY